MITYALPIVHFHSASVQKIAPPFRLGYPCWRWRSPVFRGDLVPEKRNQATASLGRQRSNSGQDFFNRCHVRILRKSSEASISHIDRALNLSATWIKEQRYRSENGDSKKAVPTAFDGLRFCPAGTPFAQRMADCKFCLAAIRSVLLKQPSSDIHASPAGRRRIPRGG